MFQRVCRLKRMPLASANMQCNAIRGNLFKKFIKFFHFIPISMHFVMFLFFFLLVFAKAHFVRHFLEMIDCVVVIGGIIMWLRRDCLRIGATKSHFS